MAVENKVMLITYADSMGGDLKILEQLLKAYFQKALGSIHILPFYPSSADRGFAPMTYREVDPSFGTWQDVERISKNFGLMYDFMINHISRSSEYFQDFVAHKDASRYRDLFIRWESFWDEGRPYPSDIDAIYKRKPRHPFTEVAFADGSSGKVWCTFDNEQIDLDLTSTVGKTFVFENLKYLSQRGASVIRLDAFAYAIKKQGTSCFFLEPEIYTLLEEIQDHLTPYGVLVLPEIHEHYTMQLKLSQKGFWVYDFALPMLMLYSIYEGKADRLFNWLKICPRKQFTTLDTHDGIGIVDVMGLLSEREIEQTKQNIFNRGVNVKPAYNTMSYNNLDIYQINSTFYSALGNRDDAYLLSRAVQFFAPGIPQVYYVGLLAGENDIDLLEATKIGRNINRHSYKQYEVDKALKRPVVQKLIALMEFRNTCPAFNGAFRVEQQDASTLLLTWTNGEHLAQLIANFQDISYQISYTGGGQLT